MTSPNRNSRERGRRLLSRINRWVIVSAVGLTGAFSVVAAESNHGKATTTLAQASQKPTATTSSSGSSGSSSSSSGNTGSANTGNTGSSSNTIVSGGS